VRGRRRRPVTYTGERRKNFTVKEWEGGEGEWWRLLPRIAAIWRGRMSFVGPSPESRPASVSLAWSLKPGLTSMEEADHTQAFSEEEREQLRLFYMKNYSPFLDAEIMIKSVITRMQKAERS